MKNTLKLSLIFLTALSLFGCGKSKPLDKAHPGERRAPLEMPGGPGSENMEMEQANRQLETNPSIPTPPPASVQVLANPAKYHERQITLEGYLSFDGRQPILFISRDDANYSILANSFHLDFERPLKQDLQTVKQEFNNCHVRLSGTFHNKFHGSSHGMVAGVHKLQRLNLKGTETQSTNTRLRLPTPIIEH